MPVVLDTVTAFFGWCAVINSVVLCCFTLAMFLGKRWIPAIHAGIFSLTETSVRTEHFSFLANYKLIILTFNIVPYIACKLIQ